MKIFTVTLIGAILIVILGSTANAMVDREPPHLPNTSTVRHEVHSGDTMYLIAVRYHVALEDLINANPQIDNPHWIYPNEKLNIPNYGEVRHR